MSDAPPSYAPIRTLFDDTHRGKWTSGPIFVSSMGNHANLLGYLDGHSPETDGSFAICCASGTATIISKVISLTPLKSLTHFFKGPL